MKNKMVYSLICAALAAGTMLLPAGAQETEIVPEAAAEAVTEAKLWDTSCSLENGILTVYIQAYGGGKEGWYWTVYTGDKGDVTLTELLTESTDEEGYAYVGSFRALEGESGEDYIRIVYTDGFVVNEYMDFNVRIEDGTIIEHTGGGQGMPVFDEDFAPIISGDWEAEDGSGVFLSLSLNPAGGFDGVVSDGSGRDGITELYTFTAEFDVIADAFLYRNGGFHAAQITDGSEPETEEAAEPEEGAGTGLIAFDPQSEAPDDVRLIFHAPDYAQEDILFVRPDEAADE